LERLRARLMIAWLRHQQKLVGQLTLRFRHRPAGLLTRKLLLPRAGLLTPLRQHSPDDQRLASTALFPPRPGVPQMVRSRWDLST
jgi:hypothetical protein